MAKCKYKKEIIEYCIYANLTISYFFKNLKQWGKHEPIEEILKFSYLLKNDYNYENYSLLIESVAIIVHNCDFSKNIVISTDLSISSDIIDDFIVAENKVKTIKSENNIFKFYKRNPWNYLIE